MKFEIPSILILILQLQISNGDFKEKIGFLESSSTTITHNYEKTNRLGYMGKYQFSKSTLKGLGFDKEQINHFLSNPVLQEIAMQRLMEENKRILFDSYRLEGFVGKKVAGINITEEGMLAAAHLVGPYQVKKFLLSGGSSVPSDANGTPLTKYLKEFDVAVVASLGI